MAKSYEEIVGIKKLLEDDYRDYHESRRQLRHFWHGRYWEKAETESRGISSIFKDLTARQSDIGPDFKLTYNVLKDVCVKFQTFLAPLPMIRMYVDPPSTPTRRNQATVKERYLYGLWAANNMSKVLADQGWYLPLMGDCFLGIYPDMKSSMCRTLLRSPENAYPIPSFDGSGTDGVIFCWKARESAVKRQFPEYRTRSERGGGGGRAIVSYLPGRRGQTSVSDPEVEIVEYSDSNEFSRWADGQKLHQVDHGFGFDLFEHVKFINVPGETWGHGAVEQAVNLVEMGNVYLSLMMQSAIENVFPVMVIEDPMKAPETLERGAGAVIPVNAGGKVMYLTPPSGNLLAQAEWAQEVERMVKTDTSMPDVNFGVANNSIITGKAINELQGAGTGSLVEMVQGTSLGAALVSWNEKALEIGRNMFPDDTIRLFGRETGSIADVNPRHFAMNIKGSQLVGSTRNEVVFMPYIDMHTKVVIGLQLAGGGLVSRQWQREQVGIPDSEAMDEEIVSEAIQDAVLSLLVQSITGENADQVEGQAQDYIEGTPHPLLGLNPPSLPNAPGAASTSGGPPVASLPGGGQLMSPALQQPPGSPPPVGAPPPTGQPAGQPVTIDQAAQQIQQIQGLQGRVFLIGEIVATGSTADTVEVAVTAPDDRDLIARSVSFPVKFVVVQGEPKEQYLEVTPGTQMPTVQGAAPEEETL